MNNYYVKDQELTYQLILSKGKGCATKKLDELFILIIDKIFLRFINKTPYDYWGDYKTSAFLQLRKTYRNFDHKKFDQSLPFITEIVKRSFTQTYNLYIYRINISNGPKNKFISLSDIYNY